MIDKRLDIEMLEYGDRVELRNRDICVYVRRELNTDGGVISQELILINVFTGEEHSINDYEDDLTNSSDLQLDIVRFAN